MGSDDKAIITGYICRLCSRMNRFVVHIYGDEGIQMQLAQKINVYLPITVNPNDPLPKMVCLTCIDNLEAQHELMEQFKWARQRVQQVSKSGTTEGCGRHHSQRIRDEFPLPSHRSVSTLSESEIHRDNDSSASRNIPRPSSESSQPSLPVEHEHVSSVSLSP